jgi:hypothetical protein
LNGNGTGALLVVDPERRVIYLGDGQIFDGIGGNANAMAFLNNMMIFISNVAKYGSHFSEMMIEGSTIPAPWDNYWDGRANGGTDNRGTNIQR